MDDCVLLPVSCCLTQVCVCDSFVSRLSISNCRRLSTSVCVPSSKETLQWDTVRILSVRLSAQPAAALTHRTCQRTADGEIPP